MEQRIVRSNSLIKSDGADYLQIGMIRRGSAVVRQDDRECVLRRGDYVLYDTTRPLRLADRGTRTRRHLGGTRGVHLATVVPVAQRRGGHEPDRHRLRRTRGPEWPARSLSSRSCLRPHDVRRKRRRRGSRQRDRQPGQVRSSHNCATDHLAANQPLRIRLSVIDARIADPALSPVDIAGSVKVSIRQLHRAFAEHGTTVSRSIRSRRLDGCRREIVQRHGVERSLTQISHRWGGFTDLAAFSRAFKAEFGISPRRYRSQAAAPTSTTR